MARLSVIEFFLLFAFVWIVFEVIEEYLSIFVISKIVLDDHLVSTAITAVLLYGFLDVAFQEAETGLKIGWAVAFVVTQFIQEFLHSLFSLDLISLWDGGTALNDLLQHSINILIQVSVGFFVLSLFSEELSEKEINL